MMKKLLAMFLALLMLGTLCACDASINREENKDSICAALTDIHDWDIAHQVIDEVVSYRKPGALEYKYNGVYNLSNSYKTYTFDAPNDFYEVVSLSDEEDFIMVIHNTGVHGVSFWCGIRKGAKFFGLTENYILFIEDSAIIAVSIRQKENCEIGEYAHDVIPFNELPKVEQDTAIYPSGFYLAQF